MSDQRVLFLRKQHCLCYRSIGLLFLEASQNPIRGHATARQRPAPGDAPAIFYPPSDSSCQGGARHNLIRTVPINVFKRSHRELRKDKAATACDGCHPAHRSVYSRDISDQRESFRKRSFLASKLLRSEHPEDAKPSKPFNDWTGEVAQLLHRLDMRLKHRA